MGEWLRLAGRGGVDPILWTEGGENEVDALEHRGQNYREDAQLASGKVSC